MRGRSHGVGLVKNADQTERPMPGHCVVTVRLLSLRLAGRTQWRTGALRSLRELSDLELARLGSIGFYIPLLVRSQCSSGTECHRFKPRNPQQIEITEPFQEVGPLVH